MEVSGFAHCPGTPSVTTLPHFQGKVNYPIISHFIGRNPQAVLVCTNHVMHYRLFCARLFTIIVANGRYQIEKLTEFDNHDFVSFIHNGRTDLNGFIAIHRGSATRLSFGATRFWHYATEDEALCDALRLSRMMSFKAALAGLNYGGAKAVILQHGSQSPAQRKQLLQTYAEKVNYLAGRFITGTDVGLEQSDVKIMSRVSPYFVGLKVDPTKYTAIGLYHSIKTCLEEVYGSSHTKDRSFAIQGLGKIGFELLRLLYQEGGQITVSEINAERLYLFSKSLLLISSFSPL